VICLLVLETKMGKAIMVNIEKCLACKSCEIACAVAHSKSRILEEAIAERPTPQRRVTVEAAGELSVPLQCRHCEDAPCISVCPTAAIDRHEADGPVLIEQDRCIGCKFCLMVCPFGVMMSRPMAKLCSSATFALSEPRRARNQPALRPVPQEH